MSQSQPLVSEPTLIWSLPLTYVPYLRAPKLHTFIHQRVTGRWGHILIVLSRTPQSLSSNLKFPLAQPNLVMGSRGLSWGPRWKNLLASSPNRHQPPLCQLSGNEAPIAKPSLAPSAPEDAAQMAASPPPGGREFPGQWWEAFAAHSPGGGCIHARWSQGEVRLASLLIQALPCSNESTPRLGRPHDLLTC